LTPRLFNQTAAFALPPENIVNATIMSAVNGAGNGSTSKSVDADGLTAPGFQPQNKMTVTPPRGEDLQKSYAAVVGSEANPKGWYGSMSMSQLTFMFILTRCSFKYSNILSLL
jgi:hypothetical protein